MKVKSDDYIVDHKNLVFDLMGQIGVESFQIEFEGSGDDGQINEPDGFTPSKISKKANVILEEIVEGSRLNNGTRFGPNGPEILWKENVSLREIIEGICYDSLNKVCGGWEINEGSRGTFIFDVKKRKAQLAINERVIEERLSEYEL